VHLPSRSPRFGRSCFEPSDSNGQTHGQVAGLSGRSCNVRSQERVPASCPQPASHRPAANRCNRADHHRTRSSKRKREPTLLGIGPVGGIMSFVVALAGAVLLIFILGKLGIFGKS
jgi:hypothetical protein